MVIHTNRRLGDLVRYFANMKLPSNKLLLLIAALSFGGLVAFWLLVTPPRTKPERGFTNASEFAARVAELIDGLASENARPVVPSNPMEIDDFYQCPGDWDPEKQREVSRCYYALLDMGKAAFPELIANINDDRYSHHVVGAAYRSVSVGWACRSILSSQIVTGGGYKSRKTRSGDSVGSCSFGEYVHSEFGSYSEWWAEFANANLIEMRVHYIDWVAEREDRYGYESPEQERKIKRRLSMARIDSQKIRTDLGRWPTDAMLHDVERACELYTQSSTIPKDWPKFFNPVFISENMHRSSHSDEDVLELGGGFGGDADAK